MQGPPPVPDVKREESQATEHLRESDERFRLLVESISDYAIFMLDPNGIVTTWNRGAERIKGYRADEIIGLHFSRFYLEEEVRAGACERELEQAARVGRFEGEGWRTRKDGSRFWASVVITAISDPDSGGLLGFSKVTGDITERKRVEKELRDANAFLDAIVENIPLMLFIKESASLRFVRFNRAGEDLLGWPRQSLVGKSDFDFWPREQAEFFVQKDRETMKRGEVVEIDEEPIQTRHQGVRILRTKKVPILDPSGNPLCLLGISEDVTERRRIEKERRLLAEVNVALAASLDYEQTLATVTELAVQTVADWCAVDVMEEHGHIQRLKVASADPGQAALCTTLERMPPDRELPHFARSALEARRPIVIERVTPEHFESFAQGPEHLQALRATRIISAVGAPLLMRGKPLGVLLFGSSNPDRVYGQDDLSWAEALADRCAVAIENARLYRASVEATQLRDQMLGVVAHDLRNPLSTILMQTSISKSGKPIEVIRRAATRMNRLIQDLLDVSLIETGQLPIQRARLSGGELVVEAVETQKILATSSSVELRLDLERGGVPEVWGEHDRLLQVFENLIGNAIKFSTAGGLITVGAAPRDKEVLFWVADTGCGIAPGSLPHVFDRFWQATKGDRRGAGLGLPIAKGIVEAHGGHLWVESTPGRGSVFFFSLPSARPAADQPSGVSA